MIGQGGVKSDVFLCAVVVRQKCVAVDIYGCVRIERKKCAESAAVVVMPVGQHGKVHRRKIDAAAGGVLCKQCPLTHIKQDFLIVGLNQQRKTVLGREVLAAGCVFG